MGPIIGIIWENGSVLMVEKDGFWSFPECESSDCLGDINCLEQMVGNHFERTKIKRAGVEYVGNINVHGRGSLKVYHLELGSKIGRKSGDIHDCEWIDAAYYNEYSYNFSDTAETIFKDNVCLLR